jgi:Protein of unknown function (DUF1257)
MSHFTRIHTRLTDEQMIRQALVRMSYEVVPADDGVYGWRGQKARAAFKIRPPRTRYEIGFVSEAGKGFSIVADWWGVKVVRQEAFTQRLTREYAYVATVSALAAKGFEVQEQVTEKSGEVRLVLRRQMEV